MYKVVAILVLLLSACSEPAKPCVPTETITYERTTHVLDARREFVTTPWVAGSLPYKVTIAADVFERALVLEAMAEINAAAGATILVESATSTQIDVRYATLTDPEAMAQAGGVSATEPTARILTSAKEMYYARRTGRAKAVFVHEFMHLLGYYSETGDVHDEDGLMGAYMEVIDMSIRPRHEAYLQEFAAFVR